MEVVNMTPESRASEVRNRLYSVSERVIQDYCELAELLHEVWQEQYHKEYGYTNFSDYVEAELDIKGRKAHFLVQITKTLNFLNIPWDEVREVGWRKMAVVAPMLTDENHKEWIDSAKEMTMPYLTEKVKAEKKGADIPSNPPIRMGLQLDADQNSIIQSAVDYAKRYEDVKSNSEAITKICYEWVQSI